MNTNNDNKYPETEFCRKSGYEHYRHISDIGLHINISSGDKSNLTKRIEEERRYCDVCKATLLHKHRLINSH